MKGFKKFNLNSALSNATAMVFAGAGSAGVDWLLKKYDVIPGDWDETIVNAVKVAGGALLASMVDSKTLYGIPKAAGDGIATVGAYNLVAAMLPEAEEKKPGDDDTKTPGYLPEGTIGRIRMGQRGFRRARVAGVQGADFMGA